MNADALRQYVNDCAQHKPMAVPLFTVLRGEVIASAIGNVGKRVVARPAAG